MRAERDDFRPVRRTAERRLAYEIALGDMAGRNGSRPHIVRTVVLRAERNGRSTEVRLNKVVRAPPLLSRPSPGGQRAGGEKLPPTL